MAVACTAAGLLGGADVGGLRHVLCDSVRPGRPDGALPPGELDWLAAALDAPTVVALHHPPVATGMGFLDAIVIARAEADALARSIAAHPQVQLVVAGRVHFGMLAVFGGGRC